MSIKRSIKARLYIFRRHFKWLFSFTLIYALLSINYVSNIELLYPSSMLISYRAPSKGSDSLENVILEFQSKLSSLEFLEKLREELGYKVNFNEMQLAEMKLKIFLSSFLPRNLTPSTWTFDLEFLKQNATWESLRNSIEILSNNDSRTFELSCLSPKPINSQAICEKALYLLTQTYLTEAKTILLDNIDLYTKDPSLLSQGESISLYKRRLRRVNRQLKTPLIGPIFSQISEPLINYNSVNLPEPIYVSLLLLLFFFLAFEIAYRLIIRSSDYIYFARHVTEKTQLEIKGSFDNHLDQFAAGSEHKDKYYDKCMLHLKSILWTMEHDSKEKMTTLFLLGFKGMNKSPFIKSLINNIESISGDKKYLILNFSPDLCTHTAKETPQLDEFLKGKKKWKECYTTLNKETIHYSEMQADAGSESTTNDNFTKSLKLFSKSYDKVICIGPSSNLQFIEQKLISNSDDIYLLLRTKSSQWRHLKYFLEELESYRSKFRASWIINSLN